MRHQTQQSGQTNVGANVMKKLLLGAVAALALAGPALAADMPAPGPVAKGPIMMPAASHWTGCYIGGNVGWGRAKHDYTGVVGGAAGLSEGRTTADGFVAGGQAGCDVQVASYLVIGVQGLVDWANADGDNASPVFPLNVFHTDVRWFATVAGRLGVVVVPSLLIYGKAGYGWVGERNTVTASGVLSNIANGGSFGGVDAGGGFEWKMNANWSLWVEYDHIFRSNDTLRYGGVGAAPLGTFPEIVKRDFDKVLVGINYRFGGPVVARY